MGLFLLLACGASLREAPAGSARPDPEDSAADDTGELSETAEEGPCPSGMVPLDDTVCIDAHEATLEVRVDGAWAAASPYATVDGREVRASVGPGRVPQAYLSGDEADAACVAAGKRLCSSEEWLAACRGPEQWAFPYGTDHVEGACNDDYAGGHPVCDYFGTCNGVFDADHMNDPGINQQAGTVAPGGSYAGCVGPLGAFDLHGNLHEWVADAEGSFRGGFYADAATNGAGCAYVTTAHDRSYHDNSTGFRCCTEAR
jgi:formylglycine-generating enzyme required for sulfatase activity